MNQPGSNTSVGPHASEYRAKNNNGEQGPRQQKSTGTIGTRRVTLLPGSSDAIRDKLSQQRLIGLGLQRGVPFIYT